MRIGSIWFEVLDYPDFGGDKDMFSPEQLEDLAKPFKGKKAYFVHFYENLKIVGWDQEYFDKMGPEEKIYVSFERGGFPCAKKYLRLLK